MHARHKLTARFAWSVVGFPREFENGLNLQTAYTTVDEESLDVLDY